RLLTFRARAADQDHVVSAPGTAWPIHGHPPDSVPGDEKTLPVLMPSQGVSTLSQRTPHFAPRSVGHFLERLPDPHLTPHVRLFPARFPRRSSTNAVPGWFDVSPRRATSEGQQSPISRTAPLPEDLPTTTFLQRS